MSIKKAPKIALMIVAGLAVAGSFIALRYYTTYKKPNVSQETVFLIYKSYSYPQMMDSLKMSGVLKNLKSFERAASKKELERHFEPGRYVFTPEMSNQQMIRIIANGWQTPTKLVLSGYIRSIERLSAALSKWCEADSSVFAQALTNTQLRDSLGFTKESYIGMFIPNTYEIYWTVEPEDLILRFKKEYDHFWNEERLAKAKSIKLTKEQVSTLASIVVEESKYEPEQPTIAGVYINRLNRGMKLQADPTVKFAVLEAEPDVKRILHRHLKIDSPYNTYTHIGLPPGPITIPTIASMDAVLNYEHHNYLYFCARAEFDGRHNFAANYSQHLKNARAFQSALNQANASKD